MPRVGALDLVWATRKLINRSSVHVVGEVYRSRSINRLKTESQPCCVKWVKLDTCQYLPIKVNIYHLINQKGYCGFTGYNWHTNM